MLLSTCYSFQYKISNAFVFVSRVKSHYPLTSVLITYSPTNLSVINCDVVIVSIILSEGEGTEKCLVRVVTGMSSMFVFVVLPKGILKETLCNYPSTVLCWTIFDKTLSFLLSQDPVVERRWTLITSLCKMS